jgi:hypothetical protein
MIVFLLLSLVVWAAAMIFMAGQLWLAPEAYEDADGFHVVAAPVSRWHHVRFHHHRRSHREARHALAA